jgi:CheY-like chemotaxis protein
MLGTTGALPTIGQFGRTHRLVFTMKPARILVAVPDEAVLALYRDSLVRDGFEVKTATNGLECVAKLRGFRPDLLALDPELPWGGSDGVVALMLEGTDVPNVPTVFLNARTGPGGLDRKGAVRLNAHCVKMLASLKSVPQPVRVSAG